MRHIVIRIFLAIALMIQLGSCSLSHWDQNLTGYERELGWAMVGYVDTGSLIALELTREALHAREIPCALHGSRVLAISVPISYIADATELICVIPGVTVDERFLETGAE